MFGLLFRGAVFGTAAYGVARLLEKHQVAEKATVIAVDVVNQVLTRVAEQRAQAAQSAWARATNGDGNVR